MAVTWLCRYAVFLPALLPILVSLASVSKRHWKGPPKDDHHKGDEDDKGKGGGAGAGTAEE